jgi:hypothetical protein
MPAMKIILPMIGAIVGAAFGYGIYRLVGCTSGT